jgi:hypothetical protein
MLCGCYIVSRLTNYCTTEITRDGYEAGIRDKDKDKFIIIKK